MLISVIIAGNIVVGTILQRMHEIATERIQRSNTGTKEDARVGLGLSTEC